VGKHHRPVVGQFADSEHSQSPLHNDKGLF
jgi:hypothetical protein